MDNKQINPEKITKPIQLLGAWLAGLIVINGSFLAVASTITTPQWVVGALVIASIINVPIFLGCIFLLQTKFRPEMQEDSYYARYLESSTGKLVYQKKEDAATIELKEIIESSNKLNISMFSGLDEGLKKVAETVKSVSQEEKLGGKYRGNIVEIERSIASSSKVIESAKNGIRRNMRMEGISINDLLPDYESIADSLADNGLLVDSIFGSTSNNPEVPKKKILGFGRGVSIDTLRAVSRIVRDNGFEYIHFAVSGINQNRIYIGSYIYRSVNTGEHKEVLFTDEIYELIMNENSSLDDVINMVVHSRANK